MLLTGSGRAFLPRSVLVYSHDVPRRIIKNKRSSEDLELELPLWSKTTSPIATVQKPSPTPSESLAKDLRAFREFGAPTRELTMKTGDGRSEVPMFVNEFWTARQRQASSLHEVSYRACFKPQLPRFFIERLTVPGDIVYDPFMGRGTTPVEAALLVRIPAGNDINPLSIVMTRPRLHPPVLEEVEDRLAEIRLDDPADTPDDLLAFYHAETLRGISSIKNYLQRRRTSGALDHLDQWIGLVSLNRLTGHSNGFFSVYTLPPNQAVSVRSQLKINQKRNQVPEKRDVRRLILKKSRQLLGDVDVAARKTLAKTAPGSLLLTGPAEHTPQIKSGSVALAVTSPPFLNIVQYAADNWLRCWFLGIHPAEVKITMARRVDTWQETMTAVFRELHRVLRPGGHVAFEVGEVHAGATKLEEAVLPCGIAAGLSPELIVINDQKFTKTANCWGVDNMSRGTNTNRIVVFRKA